MARPLNRVRAGDIFERLAADDFDVGVAVETVAPYEETPKRVWSVTIKGRVMPTRAHSCLSRRTAPKSN